MNSPCRDNNTNGSSLSGGWALYYGFEGGGVESFGIYCSDITCVVIYQLRTLTMSLALIKTTNLAMTAVTKG